MGYKLRYHEAETAGPWQSVTVFSRETLTQPIHRLTLFKTYEFAIRAFNMFGDSPWSPVSVLYMEIGRDFINLGFDTNPCLSRNESFSSL